MRRLFLSSSFADVAGIFRNVVGESCEGKSVTFIPTASIPEKVRFYVSAGRKALEKSGLRIDELDIATAPYQEIVDTLQTNDYIYVSGGNTFFLLQELKRTGADSLIIDQINSGKYYIGESAGSIILAPDIEYVQGMDNCKKAPGLKDFGALQVLDFYPLPHYTNSPFKKAVEKIIVSYEQKIPLYPLRNDQAITVHGDTSVIHENNFRV